MTREGSSTAASGSSPASVAGRRSGPDSSAQSTVAERLNELFATVTWVDKQGRRREYSTPQVARAISDDPAHDTTVSRVYLATLRSGTNTNPTLAVLRAIARFFEQRRADEAPPITASYFLDEDDESQEFRRQLADRQVRMIAMRAGNMTPAVRRQVLQMLDILDQPASDESTTGQDRG